MYMMGNTLSYNYYTTIIHLECYFLEDVHRHIALNVVVTSENQNK